MAAQDFDATNTPRDLVAALGLAAGTKYLIQNVSTVATLRVREAASAPAATARAFKVEAGGPLSIRPKAGQGVWLWTDDRGGSCPVIVGEHT